MSSWRTILAHFFDDAEAAFAGLHRGIDDRFGEEPLAIVPYRGYGNASQIVVRGRVLEQKLVRPVQDNDSVWNNLLDTYRRFATDEVPLARVRARFAGAEQEIEADNEGYFELRVSPVEPLPTDRAWHEVELTLVSPVAPNNAIVTAIGEVFVPQPGGQFGIISDIDDTVVKTDAASFVKMARTVFLGNARTRLAFPGVGALYRAMHAGQPGPFVNPIFYVSSSPWNIYDMLIDFFALSGLPKGAMFLRDWGVTPGRLPFGHRTHKLAAISELLDFYTDMPFLLLGDSGQEDPEIYGEVVRRYPNRIRGIYIRSVDPDADRIAAIKTLTEEVVAAGSALVLADDTLSMAQHAVAQGYITADALDAVAANRAADTVQEDTTEELPDQAAVVDTANPARAAEQVGEQLETTQTTGENTTIVVEGEK